MSTIGVLSPIAAVKAALQAYVGADDRAYVVYEASTAAKRFCNAELHIVRDGRIVATEVYFGWDLPHIAAPGNFIQD